MNLPESETFSRYFTDENFRNKVDNLFTAVTDEVEQFAQNHGFAQERWYNDLPLWHLHLPETADDIRRVIHLSAVRTNNEADLAILVDAHSDEANVRHGLVRPKIIGKYSTIDPRESTRFISMLEDAYDTARNISREELLRTTTLLT